MALPKLLQKLFQNNGAGDKLNKSIVPDLDYLPKSGGTVNGSIIFDGDNHIGLKRGTGVRDLEFAGSNNDGCFSFFPGESGSFSDKKSASLFLTSTGYTGNAIPAGSFYLTAMDATTGVKSLVGSPDGSLTWDCKPVLFGESGGFPVGFLALYAGSNVPNGWFRCDGSTIADMATNYPKLYAVLGTNVLPNYSGRFPMGAVSDINQIVEPGLPNISGSLTYVARGAWKAIVASGAFTAEQNTSETGNGDNKGYTNNVYFSASGSNTIYGKSTTVQPPAYALIAWRRTA